jgi:hypothetical protein
MARRTAAERASMVWSRKAVMVASLLWLLAGPAAGQDSGPSAAAGEEEAAALTGVTGLPDPAAPDTVRTNLWLAEALMGEIAGTAARSLPPAPAAVRLVAQRDDPRNDLFQPVAAQVLRAAGYDVYLAEADPARQGAVDCVFGYSVQNIELVYPDVGRTLGIWRNWIEREMTVSVLVEISEEASGRLLFSQRLERRFSDRIADRDLDAVESDTFEFTTAEPSESGWQSRAEEIVVLGTLAGLVAIYFANTGN